ncbi:MAG: DUF4290 domain-containing protein [Muribaculaceae bacterium]|nr:DUF4290 domain-containing protein [Muribaculaceae bacterium]
MLTYNTQQKELLLPEYGRTIHKMVEHCMNIENRDERNLCAQSIIKAMGNLFPALRDGEDNRRKLWDHLAIMSDFKLDIDYPYEIIKPDSLQTKPDKISYSQNSFAYRHYGKNIIGSIEKAAQMEPGEERDALVSAIANQMKKVMLANSDSVEDERIYNDLLHISHGAIRANRENCILNEYKLPPQPTGKKKKKK